MPETPESTMRPEDVPEELVQLARDGIAVYDIRDILAAVLPAARRQWFAELFGTPEEIRQREIEAKANAKPDDPAELCERARPGHHERLVRAKVAEEMRRMAEGRRFYADGNPPGDSRTWLEVEAHAFNSAAKVAEGDVGTVLALLPTLMWNDAETAHARGERP